MEPANQDRRTAEGLATSAHQEEGRERFLIAWTGDGIAEKKILEASNDKGMVAAFLCMIPTTRCTKPCKQIWEITNEGSETKLLAVATIFEDALRRMKDFGINRSDHSDS